MIEALIVSNILLWIVAVASLVGLIAVARQVGILYERIAPMGALTLDAGPKVGEAAPEFSLPALSGGTVDLGGQRARGTLVFFLSPTCPVCKKLLPIVKSVATKDAKALEVVFASDGDPDEHRRFREREALSAHPYVLSTELGLAFRVGKLPYAVLIDAAGVVRAKGLVNSREQLESLFTAQALGVASIQEYLGQRA